MSDTAIVDFIAAMEAAGVRPVEPIAQALSSGKLIRFRCEGDGPGRRNAWAVLHLDGRPAGAFGCYRLGLGRQRWRADDLRVLSSAERTRMQREWRRARERRERERADAWLAAAVDAHDRWRRARPANLDHPYLARKGMSPEGIGQLGDRLLVPMYDATGRIWNLQRISPDGTKRFLKNGRTCGLFWLAGRVKTAICLGEGVSTMAAVRAATGHPVLAAFSAGNLETVARIWRRARPDLDIVICADDDFHLPKNVGLEAATTAARAVGGRLAVPPRA